MRRLNTDFAQRGRFFTEADLRSIIAQLASGFTGLDQFFKDYVEGTAELDYDTYLGSEGLRLVGTPSNQTAPGFRLLHRDDGIFEARSVDPDGNAGRAGLQNGDTLLQTN